MTRGNSAEDRFVDALDERRAAQRILTADERRAYEILLSNEPQSDKDILWARKKFQQAQISLAAMNMANKICIASTDLKTPVEAQKDLLPYVLPKAQGDDSVTIDQLSITINKQHKAPDSDG